MKDIVVEDTYCNWDYQTPLTTTNRVFWNITLLTKMNEISITKGFVKPIEVVVPKHLMPIIESFNDLPVTPLIYNDVNGIIGEMYQLKQSDFKVNIITVNGFPIIIENYLV